MLPAEQFRLLTFLGLIAAIFLSAIMILLLSLARRIAGASPPAGRGRCWARKVILTLALVGALCVAYGYYVEPYWPSISHIAMITDKLPAGSSPIRIVQISDLHCDPEPRLEERLPDLIAAEQPDVIVFTGDSINFHRALPIFKRLLTRFAAIAPTFAVKGNWDIWDWRDVDLFGGTGVHELDGEAERLDLESRPLWIAGVAAGDEKWIGRSLAPIPAESLTVFLSHSPDLVHEVARHRVDLHLAGHTHGGQVALPFYGALITFSRFGKEYEAGLYRVERTWLYVNRGIGMEGKGAPRVRFCSRPEIAVFEIGPVR